MFTLLLLLYTHVEPRKRCAAATHNYMYWWKGIKALSDVYHNMSLLFKWASLLITFDCQTSSLLRFFLTNVSVRLRQFNSSPNPSSFLFMLHQNCSWAKKGLKENADRCAERNKSYGTWRIISTPHMYQWIWKCISHIQSTWRIKRMRPMNIYTWAEHFWLIGCCNFVIGLILMGRVYVKFDSRGYNPMIRE